MSAPKRREQGPAQVQPRVPETARRRSSLRESTRGLPAPKRRALALVQERRQEQEQRLRRRQRR